MEIGSLITKILLICVFVIGTWIIYKNKRKKVQNRTYFEKKGMKYK